MSDGFSYVLYCRNLGLHALTEQIIQKLDSHLHAMSPFCLSVSSVFVSLILRKNKNKKTEMNPSKQKLIQSRLIFYRF